jgi:hypothetical protein
MTEAGHYLGFAASGFGFAQGLLYSGVLLLSTFELCNAGAQAPQLIEEHFLCLSGVIHHITPPLGPAF